MYEVHRAAYVAGILVYEWLRIRSCRIFSLVYGGSHLIEAMSTHKSQITLQIMTQNQTN